MNRRTIQLQNAKRERDELRNVLERLMIGAQFLDIPQEDFMKVYTLRVTGAAILRAKELLERKDKVNELPE